MTEQRTFHLGTRALPRERRFSLSRPVVHEVREVDENGPVVLVCPRIGRTTRRGEHILDGPLAAGHELHRRKITRFELLDATGATAATFRQRALRPGRNWRPSWEVSTGDGPPVVVTEDATFSTVKHLRAELRGEPTVHHHALGLEAVGHPHHALISLSPEAPLPDLVMLLAALIAHRTHHPADPS